MQELTLTTIIAVFGSITYPIGLYKPVHFVCKPRTHIERKASTDTRPEKRRPDSQPQETVIPDTLHANIRATQPTLLCSFDVLHLYLMANHSRLDIRDRITPVGSFAMRMYLGNKHFR